MSQIDSSFRNYNSRTKALNVFVPAEKEERAFSVMRKYFTAVQPGTQEHFTRQTWTTRYIYMEPENHLNASPDATKLEYFKIMFKQQRYTQKKFMGHASTAIATDLDLQLKTRNSSITTLREMILSIRSLRKGHFFNEPLFHAVDFCPDLTEPD